MVLSLYLAFTIYMGKAQSSVTQTLGNTYRPMIVRLPHRKSNIMYLVTLQHLNFNNHGGIASEAIVGSEQCAMIHFIDLNIKILRVMFRK